MVLIAYADIDDGGIALKGYVSNGTVIVDGRFGAVGTIGVIGTAVVLYQALLGICCLIYLTMQWRNITSPKIISKTSNITTSITPIFVFGFVVVDVVVVAVVVVVVNAVVSSTPPHGFIR